jgi:hypothetical protein
VSNVLLLVIGKVILLMILGLTWAAVDRPEPPRVNPFGDPAWPPRVQTGGAAEEPGPVPRPAGLIEGPVPWDPAELTGYALRRVGEGPALEFRFTGPGAAETTVGGSAAFVGPVPGRWWVDDLGALNLTGPNGNRALVLSRVRAAGDRFEVIRDGLRETYVREKLARATDRP